MLIEKYGSLDLYDKFLEKIFIIDQEQLQFDKNSGWTLIIIPEKPDGTLSDNECFCIHNDIFGRIQSTDRNIIWKCISNETNENESQSKATYIHYDKIQNKKRSITKKLTKHTLQRKRQKKVYYWEKSFDEFRLMVVDPPPKLDTEESNILSSSFDLSSWNKSNEVISKMVLTHLLKRWE